MKVIFGPLLSLSVSSKTYICLANKSIKILTVFYQLFCEDDFSLSSQCSCMSDMHWMQFIIISSFSFYAPIPHLVRFPIFFSAQCSLVHFMQQSFLISSFSVLSVHISRLTSPSVVLGGDPLTIDCDFDYQVKHWHSWHMIM